jgi:glutamine amidotransferase-like uncharacterized protein
MLINNMKTIALFRDKSSKQAAECGDGVIAALSPFYNIKIFTEQQCTSETFKGVDMLAFPGGVGDADDYDAMFLRKRANAVADFVAQGGAYLGICVGAYWAGKHYFDILDQVDAVQYIKRPTADIRRCYDIAADVTWLGQEEKMFFRDGCTFTGNPKSYTVTATYANGDPMCIVQGKVGVMGACPDSLESWYNKSYTKPYWHKGRHHKLLQDFVKQLLEK